MKHYVKISKNLYKYQIIYKNLYKYVVFDEMYYLNGNTRSEKHRLLNVIRKLTEKQFREFLHLMKIKYLL